MSMLSYKKILKYWTVDPKNPQFRSDMKAVDVTDFRCEEEVESLRLIDGTGRVVAEFGPGQQYEHWMLTVEHRTPSEPLPTQMLSLMKKLRVESVRSAPAPSQMQPVPSDFGVKTGFILGSMSGR